MPWYGWQGFRRGIAFNEYELGANEKIVQRILRHAKLHVTPAVVEATPRMQAAVDGLEKRMASSRAPAELADL